MGDLEKGSRDHYQWNPATFLVRRRRCRNRTLPRRDRLAARLGNHETAMVTSWKVRVRTSIIYLLFQVILQPRRWGKIPSRTSSICSFKRHQPGEHDIHFVEDTN